MDINSARRAVVLLFLSATVSLTACSYLRVSPQTHPITDVVRVIPAKGYKPDARYGKLSLQTNPWVDQWISYFTGRGRNYMQLYLERSSRYIPLMKEVFRDRGMPQRLAYLAIVESGLNADAFSYASAVGYWQFMSYTGRRYNLRIDRYVDERRDPILSTEAAATYLDSLYSVFGNWYLALAAYNTGQGRVMRAVMHYHTRNFWKLCHYRWALPLQTKNYIPKFIATVLIAENPQKYGFNNIDTQPAFKFDSVVIHRPISLEKLAKELHVDYNELKLMNPRYKSDYVPVYADRINAIRVPVGMKAQAIADLSGAYSSGPKYYATSFHYYRVRPGDSLIGMAYRFHTTVARLCYMNGISSRGIIRAGRLMRVPYGYSPERYDRSIASVRTNPASFDRGGYQYYRIRPGDNLDEIAVRFHVFMDNLLRLNHFSRRTMIRVGQLIKIQRLGGAAPRAIASVRQAVRHGNYKYYRIRRGDNLDYIARRFHTSVARLVRMNHISRHSMIRAGQLLKVQRVVSSTHTTSFVSRNGIRGRLHIVRPGENLTLIAHRFKVSISEIAHANSLQPDSKLLAGTELIIPSYRVN